GRFIKGKMSISDLSSKQKANFLVGVFIVFALIFYYYSDAIGILAKNSNPFFALFLNIATSPVYLLLIYWLWGAYKSRGVIAGFLISVAFDIVDVIHSIPRIGTMPSDPALFLYSDTIIYRLFPEWLRTNVGVFILYIIIPILLVIIARNVIHKERSFLRIWSSV
ncbi:MAG: hypothetical protein AABY22_33335, partial [Nanoarchaeota archaeon]